MAWSERSRWWFSSLGERKLKGLAETFDLLKMVLRNLRNVGK